MSLPTTEHDPLRGEAAGVRSAAVGDGERDVYYHNTRPELQALIPENARAVLDVGCGAGAFGGDLKRRRGIEVTGVELFAEAAAIAAEQLDNVIVADLDTLQRLPYPRGHFDAMVFGDVLEHVHDPHRLLRALRPHLADDGLIVCSIPNVKHWSVLAPLLVHDRWQYEDQGLLDRTHVHFFTLEQINRMLVETGFEGLSVTAFWDPLPDGLRPLAELAGALGAEVEETVSRLSAVQYIVTARPLTPGDAA